MIETLRNCIAYACLILALCGVAYTLYAAVAVSRLARQRRTLAPGAPAPGVTILKPLRGAEPSLEHSLASFCVQDYPGPVQILFGVAAAHDPAVPVVERVIAQHPGRDLHLVVVPATTAMNPKIATLAALEDRIRHGILVLADSDIVVQRNYLASVVAALHAPRVGLVTCLYQGLPRAGLWSRMAAMGIDERFLPSVLVGLELGLARPCFGSTIALRRATLAALGGFAAFRNHLADDHALGEAVRGMGAEVCVSEVVVGHNCSERSLRDLVTHELRWARTVRAVGGAGYVGAAITHPVPLALLAALLPGFHAAGCAVLALALGARLVLNRRVGHTLQRRPHAWWLIPPRDVLSFVVYLASFFVTVVHWRGHRYRVDADGTLVPLEESNA